METIHLGLKKVAIATGYDSEDAFRIENEILIYAKDSSDKPFGTEFPEDIGVSSNDVEMLARIKVHAHEGADELIRRLDIACTNIGQKSTVKRLEEENSTFYALIREAVEYLCTNKHTNIMHGSPLHQKLAAAIGYQTAVEEVCLYCQGSKLDTRAKSYKFFNGASYEWKYPPCSHCSSGKPS